MSFLLLVEYMTIWNCFPYRYWGCILLKRYQHSPLKDVLTKPFIHNLQLNMQEKSKCLYQWFFKWFLLCESKHALEMFCLLGNLWYWSLQWQFLVLPQPTYVFLKVLCYTAILQGVGTNVTCYFDWSVWASAFQPFL